ncbi:MAG: discoidin domain-containing protein [Bryobacteraceae bacterium]
METETNEARAFSVGCAAVRFVAAVTLGLAAISYGQAQPLTVTLTAESPVFNPSRLSAAETTVTSTSPGRIALTSRLNGETIAGTIEIAAPAAGLSGSVRRDALNTFDLLRFDTPAAFVVRQNWSGGRVEAEFGVKADAGSNDPACKPSGAAFTCQVESLALQPATPSRTNFRLQSRFSFQLFFAGSPGRLVTYSIDFGWQAQAGAAASNAIRIISAVPQTGKKLVWGTKQTFRARVRYTLQSTGRASIALRIFDKEADGNLLASSDFTRLNSRTSPGGEELPGILEIKDFEVPRTLREVFLQAVLIDDGEARVLARGSERYPVPEVKLSISSVEVVQVTQTEDNRVPLIAEKPGAVRAFVKQEPADPKITGVAGQATFNGANLRRIGGLPSGQASPDRSNIAHSLNFEFSEGDALEDRDISLRVWLEDSKSEEFAVETGTDSPKEFVLRFLRTRPPLRIGFGNVEENPASDEVILTTPRPPIASAGDLRRPIDLMYPVPAGQIKISDSPRQVYGARVGKTGNDYARLFGWMRRIRLTLGENPPSMYVAVLPRSTDTGDLLGLSDPPWLGGGGRGHVAFVKEDSNIAMTFAHEVAHNLGLYHPTARACTADDPSSNWSVFYKDRNGDVHDPGFNLAKGKVVSPAAPDLMTYCEADQKWLSPFHYFQLFRQLVNFNGDFLRLSSLDQLPPGTSFKPADRAPEKQALRDASPANSLVVSGWVDRGGAAGGFDPVLRVRSTEPPAVHEPEAPHCVEFHSVSAQLSQVCFPLSFVYPERNEQLDRDYFTLLVPEIPDLARIVLRSGANPLAEISAGANPSLRIERPVPGERFEGDMTLAWTATHPQGKPLVYRVDYSLDASDWKGLALDLAASSYALNTSSFPEPGDYYFRVTAMSGLDSTSTTVGPISVTQLRKLDVPARSIAFGDIPAGEIAARRLRLGSNGTGPVTIREARFSNPQFSLADVLPVVIPAGTEANLEITFDGRSAGSQTGTLRLLTDAAEGTFEIALTGTVASGAGGGTGGGGTGGGSGAGGSGGTGGTAASARIAISAVAGWPNERNFDNPPRNAIDGDTNTFTWTTNPNNTVLPSYFGADFGSSNPVSRIRLFKDNDGGGGTLSDHFKNLTIEYTTTPASIALANRTWTRVTALTNGFNGTELLTAVAVNADGTVTRDSHNSSTSGWASLTFAAVEATGIRIGFSNVTNPNFFNHYKVHEFEAYGPAGGTGGGGGVAGGSCPSTTNIALSKTASQSSTAFGGPAANGVNGVLEPDYGFHTDEQVNPWWQVDLGQSSTVCQVRLFNRVDPQFLDRARSISINASDDGVTFRTVYRHDNSVWGAGGAPLVPTIPAFTARFVRLRLEANQPLYFNMREVEIYGFAGGTAGGGGGASGTPQLSFQVNGLDAGGRINFLSVPVNTSSTVNVTVRNTGTAVANITSIVSSNAAFSATPQQMTIAAGGTGAMAVRFAPTAARDESGALTVNVAGAAASTISLTGTGTGGAGGGTGGGGGPIAGFGNIVGLILNGGSFNGSAFVGNAQIWDTTTRTETFVLGVSAPGVTSPLLNRSNKTIDIPQGTYYTYNEPTSAGLGTAAQLIVTFANGTREEAVFAVGSLTQASPWTRLTGSANIALASTGITNANRISSTLNPGGSSDIVLQLSVPPGSGTGGSGGGSGTGGSTALSRITPLVARGWPNERNFDNPPPNAVDGNTSTFTWTTNPFNTVLPSYFGVDFGASKPVSRIRIFKDNDGGGGTLSDHFKNLVIEYTTTPASTQLPDRTWTRVTGLVNGFNGAELLQAVAVNSDGTITRDSHNSSNSGWASLTFNAVNATGIRIAFSNVTSPTFFNHYKVHEFEAYGPGSGGTAPEPVVLRADDGTLEESAGFVDGNVQAYFVTRLTPNSYPATLRQVLIQFPPNGSPLNGVPPGTAMQVVTGTTASSGPELSGVTLQRTPANIGPAGAFVAYDVAPLTIRSGSFLVGFTIVNGVGQFPVAVDIGPPLNQRSYAGVEGSSLFLYDSLPGVRPGNFLIRARLE